MFVDFCDEKWNLLACRRVFFSWIPVKKDEEGGGERFTGMTVCPVVTHRSTNQTDGEDCGAYWMYIFIARK